MPRPTRRQALVTIAAGISAGSLVRPQQYTPATLTVDEHDLLGLVVDAILPETETPGAREVGVHSLIDEDLAAGSPTLETLRAGLASLRDEQFAEMDEDGRTGVLRRYSAGEGQARAFFELVKGLTIDAYYSTEVGLVQELGYQGNTYLQEFPGCTHDHELADPA